MILHEIVLFNKIENRKRFSIACSGAIPLHPPFPTRSNHWEKAGCKRLRASGPAFVSLLNFVRKSPTSCIPIRKRMASISGFFPKRAISFFFQRPPTALDIIFHIHSAKIISRGIYPLHQLPLRKFSFMLQIALIRQQPDFVKERLLV